MTQHCKNKIKVFLLGARAGHSGLRFAAVFLGRKSRRPKKN